MIVYCDTSFLVSCLNEEDINHATTLALPKKYDAEDFVVCEVRQLELLPPCARPRTGLPMPFRSP